MHPVVISAQGLGKAYRIGAAAERTDTMAQAAWSMAKTPLRNWHALRGLDTRVGEADDARTLWALRDVSFEVRRGEVVGFVGRNGAGKSTLLKLLSRVADPSEGRFAIKGRVSSLLEVGTGFHPELTGRENVYMNGTILGMSRREVDDKFDEIVAFSGVAKFLDTPIKRYSSGMKARLAFSVAAYLEPEILIIDEVLATGDAAFQRKCLGKMRDVANSGRTVLFVSHNIAAVRSLCTRAITLNDGRLVEDGPVDTVVRHYLSALRSYDPDGDGQSALAPGRAVKGTARVTGLRILDAAGEETRQPVAGEPATVEMNLANSDPEGRQNVNLTVRNEDDVPILFLSPKSGGVTLGPAAHTRLRCALPTLPLALGNYRIEAIVYDARGVSDSIANALPFTVESAVTPVGAVAPTARQAAVLTPQEWSQESAARPAAPDEAPSAPAVHGARAPAVSVVMPVRQDETFLAPALESLLAQSFEDFELVVIDDMSSDGAQERLAAVDDPRIRILRNDQRQGVSRSLNRGIAEAQGALLARADADDVYEEHRLSRQVDRMNADPELGVLSCGFRRIDTHGAEIDVKTPTVGDAFIRFQMLFMNAILHPGVMMRTELVRSVGGYDPAYWTAQDSDLWARMLPIARFDNISDPLVRYRLHPKSVSRLRGSDGQALSLTVPARLLSAYLGRDLDSEAVRAAVRLYQGFVPQTDADLRAGDQLLRAVWCEARHREPPEVVGTFRARMEEKLCWNAGLLDRRSAALRHYAGAVRWRRGRQAVTGLGATAARSLLPRRRQQVRA